MKVYFITGAIVVLISFLVANYYKKQGFFFWRTFFFTILTLSAFAVMILKALFPKN